MPSSSHCTQVMNPKTDNELIGIYVNNNFEGKGAEAFNCLYERYRALLFRYLLWLCFYMVDKNQVRQQATEMFDQVWYKVIDELRVSDSRIVEQACQGTLKFVEYLLKIATQNCPRSYRNNMQRPACHYLQSRHSASHTEQQRHIWEKLQAIVETFTATEHFVWCLQNVIGLNPAVIASLSALNTDRLLEHEVKQHLVTISKKIYAGLLGN